MNADAFSDLVLLLVCAAIAWRDWRGRPAIAIGALLIGIAAFLGVLRFSGVDALLGPHRFFSMLSACVAFTLIAAGLRWPDAPLATRMAAAGRFVVVFGGLGVGLTALGVALWKDLVPGVSALVIVVTAFQQRSPRAIAGALLLVASFVVAALYAKINPYLSPLNSTQALHYLLAAGLALLAWRRA